MSTLTRAAVEAALRAVGIDARSPAGQLLADVGARERHAARVAATVAAARAVADGHDPTAAAFLAADLIGIGGPRFRAGEATVRMPAFAGLGRGRWQAGDGAAYRSAAEAALVALVPGPLTWGVGFQGNLTLNGEPVGLPLPWAMKIATLGLAHQGGRDITLPDVQGPGVMAFEARTPDAMVAWAAIYNRLHALTSRVTRTLERALEINRRRYGAYGRTLIRLRRLGLVA